MDKIAEIAGKLSEAQRNILTRGIWSDLIGLGSFEDLDRARTTLKERV